MSSLLDNQLDHGIQDWAVENDSAAAAVEGNCFQDSPAAVGCSGCSLAEGAFAASFHPLVLWGNHLLGHAFCMGVGFHDAMSLI